VCVCVAKLTDIDPKFKTTSAND